ncbi:excinuclease ABC subunit UvrB [Candidatus Gracilibacteria bacterium]|nr:excinuclease ABC subunit UvrB [Candidatus Gracilibacteria bacterium]OIO76839.1 MAG: excinuclease ABC subunit B [Candidatus Gracilibacteria bacterium CG1_02_38_174]PIQ41116.1 MAG: excinuclease ABC subunit B [Candidatus Gracilibacteria bacterium CG12_big_fil_rev_8_21_14_0_65_38_15]PIZ01713.1 MAG: excinuclease ABC subunit B [Candidatus Gracilibacteria bacterium CG_4_10_14_0_8_um_filter_38_28]
MPQFKLHAKYKPMGDQPQAIKKLLQGLDEGKDFQTLLGVTGSGKTFTMANIIEKIQRPTLVIAHNKTLAAQLAQEFKEFFPENAVHYFVSYYDYYQPEAFIVKTGTYIEKEATINEEIDRLRHAATESLLSRKDVIIVASVSCIYGIGEREEYEAQILKIRKDGKETIDSIITNLVQLQFKRTKTDFKPGNFRIQGDTLDIFPASSELFYSIEFFGDDIERIVQKVPITNEVVTSFDEITVFPAKHFISSSTIIEEVIPKIKEELDERLAFFKSQNDFVKIERLKAKVEYDLEMMQEVGYVNGIENYSMYLSKRLPGSSPTTLIDFFPKDFMTFIDESHISIHQIGGMYAGDRARKENLIENGFRLPSAFENRPLRFEEFEKKIGQTIFVSATPSKYEAAHTESTVEQIIRPTGLLDPEISIEDMEYVADSLMGHIQSAIKRGERFLITTITKKSSEELAEYLASNGIKVRYLHSEIETIERLEILRDLRLGKTDGIVGVNLLREGLDLPEVSFIGILDAEKIGFLRSTSSLLQIIGRAARNVHGYVVMYSHKCRESTAMTEAMDITNRRRAVQHQYNLDNGITPETIVSRIKDTGLKGKKLHDDEAMRGENPRTRIKRLELEMDIASANLDFELAAEIRDELLKIRKK